MDLVIEGERVFPRTLQESDFDDFYSWYSSDQVTKFLGMKPLFMNKAKTMFNELLNAPNGVYFGIIKKDEKRIIGYVFIAYILNSHRVAREFGIVVGDKKLWGTGCGSEATKLLLEYWFKHLKLHGVELIVLDFNKRAQHMYRKIGFVEEGIQREARLVNAKWHNVVIMGMLEQEFEK